MARKAKIIAFLNGEKGSRTRAEEPEVFTASDDRNYVVVICGGGYDEELECIIPETAVAVWGTPEFLEAEVLIGRKVLVD